MRTAGVRYGAVPAFFHRAARTVSGVALPALLAIGAAFVPPVIAAAPPIRFPDVAAGQALIEQKGCANCHGILGSGGRRGPDLLRIARGKGAAELLADMWNHVPQMVAALLSGERLPALTGTEMRDLIGYLNFVNYLGDPGDAARGGAALAQLPCLACHDLRKLGKVGPALVVSTRAASPVGLVTDLWNHYPRMHEALLSHDLPWFAWSGDQLTDLSRYLASLEPPGSPAPLLAPGDPEEGGRVFAHLGCGQCHGPSGANAWAALLRRTNALSAAENGAALLRHLPSIGGGGRAARPLPEKDMADLLAYLSLAGANVPGGDARAGGEVFARNRCSACHALPGHTPGIGPDVRDMPAIGDPYEIAALMLQHARNMKTATELKHLPWPRMKPDELMDLYAFLASQPRR
jgi:cytochrome c2